MPHTSYGEKQKRSLTQSKHQYFPQTSEQLPDKAAGTAEAVPPSKPVLVLGVDRLDTSVISDVLEVLGIDFGNPETRMAPVLTDNARGYWEQMPIADLNDRILKSLGGDWFRPIEVTADVMEGIDEFRDEAAKLLNLLYSSDRRWGLNDPRLGGVMDIWRPLLDRPHFIICVRDPRNVEAVPSKLEFDSWQRHTEAAMRASAGAPRIVVDYNALLNDTVSQVERIARFLEVHDTEMVKAAVAAVRGEERHQTIIEPITDDPNVPSSVTELYVTTSRLARLTVSPHDSMPVLWLTGLPGAGKSTIAALTAQILIAEGIPAEVLDGDEVRKALSPTLGFTRDDRASQAKHLAWLAKMLHRHGVVTIIASVSPFRTDRWEAAELFGNCFEEIWIHADASVCRARDPKGLWRRCELGEISGVTGFDAPYENPLAATMKLETENRSIESCANELANFVISTRVTALFNNR